MSSSSRVRIAVDIDVLKGDPEKVAAILFKERKQLSEFAASVILVNDEETKEFKTEVAGASSHVHPNERDDLPCDECRRYSGRTRLASIDD